MNHQDFFFIRTNRRYERIEMAELIYVESCGGYLKLVTDSKSWMVHTTMLRLEEKLPASQFCRIHRSYMIAINRVLNFDRDHVTIRENANQKIKLPIGPDRYKNALLDKVTTVGEATVKVIALKSVSALG